MKTATILLLVFAAVPLLIYPFVLLANVMSLAGTRSGSEPMGQVLVSYAFLFTSTLYPLAYLICAILSVAAMKRGRERAGLYWGIGPIAYLLGIVLLAGLWMMVS